MSFLSTFKNKREAVVEIEDGYLQFILPDSGKNSAVRVPFNGRELHDVLKVAVPAQLKNLRSVSLVLHAQSGSKILPFPTHLNKKEILSHLGLKREEYFGTKTELVFALRETGSKDGQSREYLVSFVHKSFLEALKNTFEDLGYAINRVVTVAEALIGAYENQKSAIKLDQVCLLTIGFSDVNMVVLNKGIVIGVRTAITGSLKELETRLMKNLKLTLEEVEAYLLGKVAEPDANSLEIINQNKRELLARITPFFAFIRSKKGVTGRPSILLAMPYLHLVGLKDLLEKTFSGDVQILDAQVELNKDFKGDVCWLKGGSNTTIISLLPPKPPFFRFTLTPKVAWLFILFFLLAPLAFIRLNIALFTYRTDILKVMNTRNSPVINKIQSNQKRFKSLKKISEQIRNLQNQQSNITSYISTISSVAGTQLRLTEFAMDPTAGTVMIKGDTPDTAEAIQFWNRLGHLPLLQEAKISFPNGQNAEKMTFTISAKVKK